MYEGLYKERKKYPKGSAENYGLKIALNGVYGKSNDRYSFLYDPQFTMKITINGQILLTMLAEKLVDNIEELLMLQINTDGLTVKIPKTRYEELLSICEAWEDLTGLELEYAQYSRMIIRDVNNYIAVTTDGKSKTKGAFEINKDWHKNHSMRIIPLALHDYFVKDIPIQNTINNSDIWNFMKTFSTTKGWTPELHTVKGVSKLQKTNRYIVSKTGGGFYKHHEDGRLNSVEAGYNITIINDFNNINDYLSLVDKGYYIKECNKIISTIESNQLSLF